jgi:hypothetical protein
MSDGNEIPPRLDALSPGLEINQPFTDDIQQALWSVSQSASSRDAVRAVDDREAVDIDAFLRQATRTHGVNPEQPHSLLGIASRDLSPA